MAPSHPNEQAAPEALPMEADPSGFTERAPALGLLLPDEALSRALAGGDALAVHAALTARYAREPSGPARDTLRTLLSQPALFAVSEVPPRLGGALGTGPALVGLPPPDQQAAPFIATRAVRLLGLPVWPLSQHLVRRGRDGQLEVLGRVPPGLGFRALRGLSRAAAGLVVLAGVGGALSPLLLRELFLVNGLSRPVEVYVDGRPVRLAPGQTTQQWKLSLGGSYRVSTVWAGKQHPLEERSVAATQRAVYNVLGAASLAVEEPPGARRLGLRPLEGSSASLSEEQRLVVSPGGWERRVQELEDGNRVREAAALALEVAMADPLAARAREVAARYMMLLEPREAEEFAWKLYHRYPDDTASHLVQDVLIAIGREEELSSTFGQPRYRAANSVQLALLYARAKPLDRLREAYDEVLTRFPEAPEAHRAVARIRLADGYPARALELLDAARTLAPESLEDVELRVRALISLKRVSEASAVVREYAEAPNRRSWELGVLAGRVARIAGPSRTQYVPGQLVPAELLLSAEARATFALLTGERELKEAELQGISDPLTRDALELSRLVLTDLDAAVARMGTAREGVFRRMPLEAAAVLALELHARGREDEAARVFRSHFALMLAREPLRAYVRSGEVRPRFQLLAPELLAAAYLVRSRAVQQDAFVHRAYARWTDSLGGFARRALDPGFQEPEPTQAKPLPRLPRPWR